MATIAEILLAKGNAAAANTLQRGNIYADLIRNLSSVPGQVMQQQRALEQDRIKQQIQQQQLQTGQQNLQIGQMDIAAKQRDVDADALAGLLPRLPNGDLDIDKIGEISGSHDPSVVTHAIATAQKLNTAGGAYREQRMRLANLRDEQLGELGLQLKQNPNDLGTFQMIVADGTKSGLIDKDAAPAMLRNAIEQPGFMGQQADAWISRSKEARAASASKIVNVPKDSTPFLQSGTGSGTTFAPLPGYKPKRETVEVNGQLVDKDTGERIGAPVPKQAEESAIKREWNDYVAQGGKLGFNDYMDMDANRKASHLRVTTGQGSADDIKEAVQCMIDGKCPPQLPGRASINYTATLAEAQRRGYNLAGAATDWAATQKHIATMNGAQQLRLNQAVNALPEMLDKVDDLAKQWNGGGFAILNRANLAAAKNGVYGTKAAGIANQLDSQIADVVADLGNVYMGGNSPTDHALQLAGKSLQADWSEPVLRQMVTLAKQNVQIRRNSINNTGVAGASEGNPYMPASAAPAPAAQGNGVATPAGRTRVLGPNGQTGTVQTGTPLPAGWKAAP